MIRRTIFTNCKNFERFQGSKLKKIKGKTKLSLVSASPRRALASTKVILRIFTAANDIPNLAHCLLMASNDLEKRKHRNFLEKKFRWRAPTFNKNPMEPSLMTFRFSVVEIDTTIESSPLWFLIGFRLQRLGKRNRIKKFNSIETGNLTFEW